MCRLYGQISPGAVGASDFLVDSERSLLRQSNFRSSNLQKDGWGFGYFQGGQGKVVKSPKAAFDEAGRFTQLASKIRSKVVIGHLRAASNPLGLAQSKLMRPENAQPFTDGRFVFAHNGTVEIPTDVIRFLGPYQNRVKGVNDSEAYFWQFRKFFDLYGDVPRALQACVDELDTLWDYCRGRFRDRKRPYSSLNVIIGDGEALHGLCLYPQNSKSSSLFDPRQRWHEMRWGRRDRRVIFASETLDGGRWGFFRNGEILSAFPKEAGIEIRRQKIRTRFP